MVTALVQKRKWDSHEKIQGCSLSLGHKGMKQLLFLFFIRQESECVGKTTAFGAEKAVLFCNHDG